MRNSLGFKAPRGWGWITNPRRAAYNRIDNRTTVGLGKGCVVILLVTAASIVAAMVAAMKIVRQLDRVTIDLHSEVDRVSGFVPWSSAATLPAAQSQLARP